MYAKDSINSKAMPIVLENPATLDREFVRALVFTLSEWDSGNDDQDFEDLQ